MSKYHNKKTEIDGIVFDSRKEGNRYLELKILEKAGAIKDLKLQPRYELVPKYKINGRAVRKCEYVADFEYFDTHKGEVVVEDVKSAATRTDTYKIKKKLFEYRYKQEITEI